MKIEASCACGATLSVEDRHQHYVQTTFHEWSEQHQCIEVETEDDDDIPPPPKRPKIAP